MKRSVQEPARRRAWGWCSKTDVVLAFRIVGQEIRSRQRRYEAEGLTLADACDLGRRIKDQRDLVRQVLDRRTTRHARRLLGLNRAHARRLTALCEAKGLSTAVLVFR